MGLECWALWWVKGGERLPGQVAGSTRGHEQYEEAYRCNTVSGRWPSKLREQWECVTVHFRSGVTAGPGVGVGHKLE